MKRELVLAWIAFAIVCVIWGTTYLAIRIAIETLPTFLFTGVRFVIGGTILFLIRLSLGDRAPRRPADYLNLLVIGFLMVGMGNVAVVWAEHYVTSGFAALLVAAAPFWMAMIEAVRPDGEALNARKWLGMAVGFAGVALLVTPQLHGGTGTGRNFLLGVLVIQIGSIAWQLGSVRSKYRPTPVKPLMAAALQMIFGGSILTLIGLFRGEAGHFVFTARTLTAFLYLVIFGSVIAYGAYVYALSQLPTSTVSLYAYANPAVAVLLGWAMLGERIGWMSLVAMVVIFAGMALVQSGAARTRRDLTVAPAIRVDGLA